MKLIVLPSRATQEMSRRHAEQEQIWRKSIEEEHLKIVQLEEEIGKMKENHGEKLRQQVFAVRLYTACLCNI